jgi:hypothetical protein
MKGHKLLIISSMLGLSLLAAAPALAQEKGRGPWQIPRPGNEASTTPRGAMQMLLEHMGMRPALRESFGGKVTAVSAPDFSLEIPALGRLSTTTINVVTDASTTFRVGTSTGSIGDVAIGDYALVEGRYATSTQTLTALRVNVTASAPNRGQEVRAIVHDVISQRVNEELSTTTPPRHIRSILGNILQGIFGFFHR